MTEYQYAIHDTGAFKIELRRRGNYFEFRPILTDNPTNSAAVYANALLRTDGSWAPVPENLMREARAAFEEQPRGD